VFLSLSALPRLYPAGVGHAMPYHPEVVVVVVVLSLCSYPQQPLFKRNICPLNNLIISRQTTVEQEAVSNGLSDLVRRCSAAALCVNAMPWDQPRPRAQSTSLITNVRFVCQSNLYLLSQQGICWREGEQGKKAYRRYRDSYVLPTSGENADQGVHLKRRSGPNTFVYG